MTKSERRALLTATLRSKEYAQIRCKLRNNDVGRCCLGVACDVYRKHARKGHWQPYTHRRSRAISYDEGAFVVGQHRHKGKMPLPVANWFGFVGTSGEYTDSSGRSNSLALDNDVRGKSFKQIANTIDRAPKGMFND